jgi:hypothetical protein
MLGGMFWSCLSAMCLRTISEYKKRSAQMRQCHWSKKMGSRGAQSFGIDPPPCEPAPISVTLIPSRGSALLGITAAGLLAFGLYGIAEAAWIR